MKPSSIIATALMTSIVVTILSVLGGFIHVDNDKIKLIQTFGGTKKQILTKVILPASIPTIVNALKINVGLSFVGVIVGGAVNVGMKNNIIKILNTFQFYKQKSLLNQQGFNLFYQRLINFENNLIIITFFKYIQYLLY